MEVKTIIIKYFSMFSGNAVTTNVITAIVDEMFDKVKK